MKAPLLILYIYRSIIVCSCASIQPIATHTHVAKVVTRLSAQKHPFKITCPMACQEALVKNFSAAVS